MSGQIQLAVWCQLLPSLKYSVTECDGKGGRSVARCWWRSWLRHRAPSRKVAGSIPDSVIGIFNWHNPFDRTMALGSTQPLTEMSTRSISWGVKADNLSTFMCWLSWNLGASNFWNTQGLSRPVMGLLYLFLRAEGLGGGGDKMGNNQGINEIRSELYWLVGLRVREALWSVLLTQYFSGD